MTPDQLPNLPLEDTVPVQLGAVESHRSRTITVDVTGARSGQGQATWGQWAIRAAMREVEPDDHVFNMCLTGLLDRPVRLAAALAAVRGLLVLHDSLRTRFRTGPDGAIRQHLDGAGGLVAHLFEADGPGEVDAVEAAVEAAWTAVSFDHEREWPLRVALIGTGGAGVAGGADGVVVRVVLVVSHTATDAMGLRVLRGDFAALLAGADPAGLRARRGFQPLDEAAYQVSATGRRRDEAARRYWRAGLAAAPARVFAPAAGPRTFRRATLLSPALPPALDTLAQRWHLPPAAVLLAAVSAAVARESGRGSCALQVMVSNRFIPSLRSILSPVTLEGLFLLDADAASFEVLARRAWEASVKTYFHSYYDKAALNDDIDRLAAGRDRPGGADRSCWFNDLRDLTPEAFPSWAQRRARLGAPDESSVEWSGPLDDQGEVSVAWHIYRRHDWLPVLLTLNAAQLDQPAGERMLADVEASIVDAAHRRRDASSA